MSFIGMRIVEKKIQLVKINDKIIFCLTCGRLLHKKWNKFWDGKNKNFCNNKCEKAHKGV